MAVIRGFAEMLGGSDVAAEQRQTLSAMILEAVDRFVGLTQELLAPEVVELLASSACLGVSLADCQLRLFLERKKLQKIQKSLELKHFRSPMALPLRRKTCVDKANTIKLRIFRA